LGKPAACWFGAQHARGDVLVFVDADVSLAPDALRRLATTHRGGLLSVQPHHRTVRRHESLSAPFNLVSAMGSGAFARWGAGRAATAFGPCLVTSRADYFAVGGHASVAREVVEDIALAKRYRACALPVECRVGASSVTFRMYPSGLRQLIEGWTKNLALGARDARPLPVSLAVGAVVAALWLGAGTAVRLATMDPHLPVWLASYVLLALGVRVAVRRLGRFRWWAWALYPLPLAAFVAVFARSLWCTHVRRRVAWRGRTVPIRRPDRGAATSRGHA
jgi:4,4'-diaponeurosporenoate glycosyltransferase